MKPITILACAAVLAAAVVYVGQAAPNKPATLPVYEFVGFSTATRDGDDGFVNMNIACQADVPDGFGPDARLASVAELVESANTAVPSIGNGAYISPGSGPNSGTVGETIGAFSCNGYSSTGQGFGIVVTQIGAIIETTCSLFRQVACSAPVQ